MKIIDFISHRIHIFFSVGIALWCGIGFVVTQVQANNSNESQIALSNPHHIPDELNPKFRRAEDGLQSAKIEVKEVLGKTEDEVIEEVETIHSIVFKSGLASAVPVYDYSTGTSN